MPNIDVLDMQGKKVDSMELSEEIFAVEVNVPAMHLVVRSILANKRQGTQSALTRGMVRGGGRVRLILLRVSSILLLMKLI